MAMTEVPTCSIVAGLCACPEPQPDLAPRPQVSVLEMDGQFDKLEELIYVESHLSNTSAKFYGEITQQMLKNSQFPGSTNGTGLFQTIVGLKIREVRLFPLPSLKHVSSCWAAPDHGWAQAPHAYL